MHHLVTQDGERQFVGKEVVADVREWVVRREYLVIRHDRPDIEIRLFTKGEQYLERMAVQLLG